MMLRIGLARYLTLNGAQVGLLIWLAIAPAHAVAGENAQSSSNPVDLTSLIDWGLDGSRAVAKTALEKDISRPPQQAAFRPKQPVSRASKSLIGSLAKFVGTLLKGVCVVVVMAAKFSLGLCAFIFGAWAFGR